MIRTKQIASRQSQLYAHLPGRLQGRPLAMGRLLADRRAQANVSSLSSDARWYPARVVTISGAFALAHASELLNLVRHREREENREHPEHRIMRIEEKPGTIVIETTDVHLPHAIGEALHDAFKGSLKFRYPEESYFVEVRWDRES